MLFEKKAKKTKVIRYCVWYICLDQRKERKKVFILKMDDAKPTHYLYSKMVFKCSIKE